MVAEIGEFKGHKIIKLVDGPEDPYPFSFGYGKAKKILEHIKEIEEFVKQSESEKEEKQE